MLLLAFELVVTGHMALNHVGGDAMVVAYELVRQSGAGKVGFRLRNDGLLRSAVQGDEQCTARESDFDRAGPRMYCPL